MKHSSSSIIRTYLTLISLNTLATSFIWGVNTLFLLDAGLTNAQAFLANGFFTLGQVVFEIPTGIVADMFGRRVSYIIGTILLSFSTLLYFLAWQMEAPFVFWAITSILLGFGYTFFSGATEAWLVDALAFTKYKGKLDSVFASGQIAFGVSMLIGAISGGVVAQYTSLGMPYIIRAMILLISFVVAILFMKDLGFVPDKKKTIIHQTQEIFSLSLKYGIKQPSVRWVMIAAPFSSGVLFYAFYAMQPYLLELYGDEKAYSVAGLVAAIVAGSQIFGGILSPHIRKVFHSRTSLMITMMAISVSMLTAVSLIPNFYLVIFFLCIWGLAFATTNPVRQAYLNGLIPSKQRATVLSFDSLMGSSGGIVIQPALGRIADVWNYPSSFFVGSLIQAVAIPFLFLAKKSKPESDELD